MPYFTLREWNIWQLVLAVIFEPRDKLNVTCRYFSPVTLAQRYEEQYFLEPRNLAQRYDELYFLEPRKV